MRRLSETAIVVGVLVGVAYTWSPLAVLFAAAMPIACWIAARGLPRVERKWIVAGVALAIVVRLLALATLLVVTNPMREQFGSFFPDAHYTIQRSWWIRNLWFGIPIGPHALFGIYDTYGASSFSYFLAAVQALVGPSPYGVDLISVAAGLGAALILFRLARRAYGPGPAMCAFVAIAFWPTMIAWSVSALREATQVCLVAIAFAATMAAARIPGVRARLSAAAVAAIAVYAVGTLRSGALLIVTVAISLALVARAALRRAGVAVAVGVAIVAIAIVLVSRTEVRAFIEYQTDLAANRHLGQATTSGRAYRLLDERFYAQGPQSTFTVTPPEAARFFARAAAAFVLVPLPWHASSWSEIAVVPQQVAWYALVALAAIGIAEAWRRDALFTALLLSYAAAGIAVIAPNSGNIGTLVRHRDTIVPAVACLAGVGLNRLAPAHFIEARDRPRARDRGFNIVDALAVTAVALMVALAVATVRVFRPLTPTIASVAPAVVTTGNRRLAVRGRDLTGYLRLFVAPAGEPLVLSNPVNHGRSATWHAESSSAGSLDVPPRLERGRAYDLYVYDEGRQRSIVRRAFRID